MNELDLFVAANAIADPAERAAYLGRVCADQPEPRRRLEALLAGNALSRHPLDQPPSHPQAADGDVLLNKGDPPASRSFQPAPCTEAEGTLIAGRYKLRQQIGEGGMGTVWMADQTEPVKRKVAVKLIRVERGQSKTILARFEAERQAIALMDHPHIAKLLDAGTTNDGAPFFVMELVKGIPLNDFCDQHKLSIAERLNLFMQVCSAVQHAHQKGIIHRDLKPSNILVESHDGKPVPKVIDFGLAKATTGLQLTDQSMFTAFGSVMGTPLYMAPEQAHFNAVDVDTRADVYALGVVLYELLTGSTPLTQESMKKAALDEVLRLIREQEAPTPSSRLSSAESAPSVAASRQMEPLKLGRFVKGELDWIVLKALSKDRDRRYETANGFAKDIERFLNHEPVTAGPPSASYRLKKLVQRNRGQVIAASLVLLALVCGVIGTSVGLFRAERARAGEAEQRRQAETARAEAVAQETKAKEQEAEAKRQATVAKEQEAEAKKQAEIAEAVAKFQTEMLAAVDPNQLPKDPVTGEPIKDAVTVLQALQAAVKLLDEGGSALKDQPLVEAGVRGTIGTTLRSLARYDEAEPNLRRSLELRRASLPAGHPGIAVILNNLALLLHAQNKLAEAEPLYRESLEIQRAAFPAGHPAIAYDLSNLAALLKDQNKPAEAEPLFREALAIKRAAHPAGHPAIANNLNWIASLLLEQNKLAEAEPLQREALAIFRATLPAGHPNIAQGLHNLVTLLQAQNKPAEAEPLAREALAIFRAAFPAGHPMIASGLNNLGALLLAQNKLAEAEPLFREALAIDRASLPAGHPDIATSLDNLAKLLRAQNKLAEAEPLQREALAIRRAAFPAGHPTIALGLNNLAKLLQAQNKLAEAEPLAREALAIVRAALPARHPTIALALQNLAGLLAGQKKHAEAEPLFREALAINRASLPAGHPAIASTLRDLADVCASQGKTKEAVALHKEMFESSRAALRRESPELAGQLAALSMTVLTLKAWDEAEPLIREALTIREKIEPDAWTTFNTKSMLGGSLLGQEKYAEAEPLLLTGYEGLKAREAKIPEQGKVRLPEALDRLIELYTATNKPDEVKKYRELRAEYPMPEDVDASPREKK